MDISSRENPTLIFDEAERVFKLYFRSHTDKFTRKKKSPGNP